MGSSKSQVRSIAATLIAGLVLAGIAAVFGGRSANASPDPCQDTVSSSEQLTALAPSAVPVQPKDVEGYVASLGEAAGVLDVRWDGLAVRVVVERGGPPDLGQIPGVGNPPAGVELSVSSSQCFTRAMLEETTRHAQAAQLDDGEFMSFGYSPVTDRISVTTNMSEDRVLDVLGVGGNQVTILPAEGGRLSRTSDAAPHQGGARITSGGYVCSSGFSMRNASGTRYSTTAGHCPSGTYLSGSNTFSTSYMAPNFPTVDVARLGGSTYTNRTYSANDNTTTKAVIDSGDPANGYTYCEYGQTTRRSCFTQNQSGQQFCDSSGCTLNLSTATKTSSFWAEGDSGGPVSKEYAGGSVGARGWVVAGEFIPGPNYYILFYHKTSTVTGTLGLSVLFSP